jgi:hypothetical protein
MAMVAKLGWADNWSGWAIGALPRGNPAGYVLVNYNLKGQP